jgi:hypothetical protein
MKTLFLKDIDTLCSKDMLMDMSLVAAEARYLLRLVCSPEGDSSVAHRVEETPEENVSRVVEVPVCGLLFGSGFTRLCWTESKFVDI